MPHVPTAAVHTGLVSKRYTAPKLGGAYAVTADSSSLQSVAQLEATVSVKSGAEKAPSHALSADSSQQPPAQLGAEVSAESRLRGAESHGLPAGPSRHQPPAQGKPAQREQAQHGLAQHEPVQHGLAQHGPAQHGLAQREQAHQFARDMLSSRWANAPWADALTAYLCRPDAQHASEHTGLQTNLPGGVAHMAQSEAQHASGKSAQARVSCNPPPLAGGDPKAGDSAVVQRLLHDSADPLSAGAGDWQGPAGTGKPSGMAPKSASQLLTAVTPPFPLTGVTPKTRSQLMMPSAGLLLPLASPMPSSGVPLKLLRLFHARSAFLPPVGAADQLQFN
jgi:hypothetical protein